MDQSPERFLSFADLRARGLVMNRTTLKRWITVLDFPPGALIGPNTRRWRESDIAAWLARRTAAKDAA